MLDEPPVEMMSADLVAGETDSNLSTTDDFRYFVIKATTDGTSYAFKVRVFSFDVSKQLHFTPESSTYEQATVSVGAFPTIHVGKIAMGNFETLSLNMPNFNIVLYNGYINRISYTEESIETCSLILDAQSAYVVKSSADK